MRSILRTLIRKDDCAATLVCCPPAPPSGSVRIYAEAPRQGGEGRQGEREEISRPGWLAALPSPHDGWEEEEDVDEAGRMAERRGDALWLLFAGDVVARCGDGIALNRTGWPSFPHPVRCCERVRRRSAGDGVDGVYIRRSRREARNWRR